MGHKQRDGFNDIGACVMLALLIWGAAWLIGVWQAVEVT